FITGRISKRDFDDGMAERLNRAQSSYSLLNQLVAPRFVDFNLNDYYRYTRTDRRLDNSLIEDLVLQYLSVIDDNKRRFQLQKSHQVEIIIDENEQLLRQTDKTKKNQLSESGTVYRIFDSKTNLTEPATFDSDVALQNESIGFLAAGHPLVEEAIDFFVSHHQKRSNIVLRSRNQLLPGLYLSWLVKYKSGLQYTDLVLSFQPANSATQTDSIQILDQLPFLPTDRSVDMLIQPSASDIESCRSAVSKRAKQRGHEIRSERSKLFRSEESKIEISFGKKLRQLEEKKDIERLRSAQNPAPERRAVLTRTENEIVKARQEMQLRLSQLKTEAQVEFDLELLQIYTVI
ncbi:MAG: ATP-dependent helicase, partial [Leptonema sp. (in: Bacteria)]|nr:ATP-dependent helicase [Leptonema sp. (in: bacteria)]